ncbi:universal stress protein [Kitasatospora albolonga]|uniref:universal stress protein n=1 Tax=Kitasatospora albolonga TaxID=68173 RepID=UPI0031EA2913
MSLPVLVGVDGSPQSEAAVRWAAREAGRRRALLHLVHVAPAPLEDGAPQTDEWSRAAAALPAARARLHHLVGDPVRMLAGLTRRAGIVVLGTGRSYGLPGRPVGSVGPRVAARASCPVVLVPAPFGALWGAGGVVLGIDVDRVSPTVAEFAFGPTASRGAVLRALEAWTPFTARFLTGPQVSWAETGRLLSAAERARLRDAAGPWRGRYPQVRVASRRLSRGGRLRRPCRSGGR